MPEQFGADNQPGGDEADKKIEHKNQVAENFKARKLIEGISAFNMYNKAHNFGTYLAEGMIKAFDRDSIDIEKERAEAVGRIHREKVPMREIGLEFDFGETEGIHINRRLKIPLFFKYFDVK